MTSPPRKRNRTGTGSSTESALRVDPEDRPRRGAAGGDSRSKGPRREKGRRRKAGRPRRGWGFKMALALVTAAIWVAVGVGGLVAYYAYDLPDVGDLNAATRRPSVTFLAADGAAFATFGDVYGAAVRLAELPPHLPQAVLATEDRRFFDHPGLDPIGLLRATAANLRAGRIVQGGSTITQQLAKNLFLTPERSLKRKVQEVLMALWLENNFSKEQILTLYLNRVYLGAGTFGVDAAARRYFDRGAGELTLYQSALLAGLLKAPTRYNPLSNPELSQARTRQVLANMVDAGFLEDRHAEAALRAGPGRLRRLPPGGRYFADWVMEQVGAFGGTDGRDLVVATTLDMAVQRRVEAEMEAALANAGKAGVSQGAVVVLSPDGAVRAMIGGRDYNDSQFNRAAQALRQPGSAFKPFIYLAALEAGLSPDDVFDDAPLKIGKWRPGNFTNAYAGPVTLREALAKSINTVAIRVSEQVGRQRVIAAARRLGVTAALPNDASLALGTGEVTLLELTGAYAALANDGAVAWPYGVVEVRDGRGRVLHRRDRAPAGRVLDPVVVGQLNAMLANVITTGTGRAAAIDRPAAGKTGTTQDYRDAWFVGYTADLVAGVWLGNDDGAPMNKVTGSGMPAELWKRIMTAGHAGLPPRPLPGTAAPPPPMAMLDRPGGLAEGAFQGPPLRQLESAWNSLVRRLTGR